jgi:two-component system copper resistance phosphate regulon response regulator CusR
MRILLAEDEPKVAEHIRTGLVSEGFDVDVAVEGDEALRLAQAHDYDFLLLDVMMPGKDGFAVVRALRRKQIATPVIFLTARGDVEDRVRGLDAGADDYLVKPFSLVELLARMRVQLRRRRPAAGHKLTVADLELDLMTREALRAGAKIELTQREFKLLEFLMSTSPRVVSKTAIMEHVWEQHFGPETNVVNVYIQHLREKIDRPGLKPLIQTERGAGFAVREEGA